MPLTPIRKIGPLFESTHFKDVKDPCITFDGTIWHIYGSGGNTVNEEWEILHATAPSIEGPWTELGAVTLRGVDGIHIAAPSVVYDSEDELFHMVVQKDFIDVGGGLAYLVSSNGHTFTKMRTLMRPTNEIEAGLYDPQFCIIDNKKYLVYSGIPEIRPSAVRSYTVLQPDVYLAKSTTDYWSGHWKRMKAILRHEDIAWHHNDREHPDYEWGIEGPELQQLPGGLLFLNATSFITEGRRGTRQRVFFALADDIKGPYVSLGPVLSTENVEEWENGENGHASSWIVGEELYLFYQARSQVVIDPKEANNWRYGIAVFKIADILEEYKRATNETA
ncbi:MAG: hypothetical protein JWL75_161 [Parcubacteria group bacterium]|nr:hypothetical protein [Parcubacteria group bacterium]